MISWDMLSNDLTVLLDAPELSPEDIVKRVRGHSCPEQAGREVLDYLLEHIEHGGNRTESIVALVRECRANPFFEERTVNTMHMSLLFGVLDALLEHETSGAGLRTEQGGNVLHHLVQSNSVFTLAQLVIPGKQMNQYMHDSWIGAAQNDGKTPLHLLWQRAIASGTTERAFWGINEGFLMRGARLDAEDGSGMTVLRLMELGQQLRADLFQPSEEDEILAMERVLPHMQYQALDHSTRGATQVRHRRI